MTASFLFWYSFFPEKSQYSRSKGNSEAKAQGYKHIPKAKRQCFENRGKGGNINGAQNHGGGGDHRQNKLFVVPKVDIKKASCFAFTFKNVDKLGKNKGNECGCSGKIEALACFEHCCERPEH